VLLAAGAVLAWALVVLHTAWMITHPPRRGYTYAVAKGLPSNPGEIPSAAGGPRPFREWSLRGTPSRPGAPGPTIAGWDITGDDPDGPIVVFSHGWGESRVHALTRLPALARHARRVVLYDLRGHGESEGASHLGTAEVGDLLAVLATVSTPDEHDSATASAPPVVLAGFSLGAGVSIAAAATAARAEPTIAAVIAEAPYRFPATPAARVLEAAALPHRLTLAPALALLGVLSGQGVRWGATRLDGGLPAFDRAALARALPCPLLVLHATQDAVVPVEDARAIADAALGGRLICIDGAGHTDAWTNQPSRAAMEAAVSSFLRALPSAAAPYDPPR